MSGEKNKIIKILKEFENTDIPYYDVVSRISLIIFNSIEEYMKILDNGHISYTDDGYEMLVRYMNSLKRVLTK